MFKISRNLSLVLLAAMTLAACESSSGGSSRTVMDATWRGDSGYSARYDRSRDRYRDTVQQVRNYDRAYYESRIRTQDSAGNLVPLSEQVQFIDNAKANVSNDRVTTAGVKGKTEYESAAVFTDANGQTVSLSDYAGSPVVLVFTRGFPGYICPMCTTYTAQITKRFDEFEALGAKLLLVFPGEASQVDDFIAAARDIAESDRPLPFPVLLDPDLKAVKSFNIRADLSLPATYIFDGQGKTRYAYVGEKPHERPSIDSILSELKAISRGN